MPPPPPPGSGGVLQQSQQQQSQQQQQQDGARGEEREDDETEENRQQRHQPADFLIRQDDQNGNGDSAGVGLGLGVRLRPSADSMSNIVSILEEFGYNDEQSNAFLSNETVDYSEFAGLSVDQKVSRIKKVLNDANLNENPEYIDLTADEIISANLSKKERLVKGTTPNLLSRDFAVNNELDSITQLSSAVNTASALPFTPGGDDDPYQLAFDVEDDDEDDDAPTPAAAVAAVPPTEILTAESVLASNSRIVELQEQFQERYQTKLNTFIGETPLQQDNAVSINKFLTQVAREEPLEVEREKVRRNEEIAMKEFLRKNYNPNSVSTQDAVSFDNVKPTSRYGDYDLTFERRTLQSIDEVEEKVNNNSDGLRRANVERTLRNAIDSVRENEESTLGGFLGNTNGTKSLGNGYTMEDYLKVCGIDTIEQFQKLLNEKIEPPTGSSINNDSILYDQTKLTFLPNEKRPRHFFPSHEHSTYQQRAQNHRCQTNIWKQHAR